MYEYLHQSLPPSQEPAYDIMTKWFFAELNKYFLNQNILPDLLLEEAGINLNDNFLTAIEPNSSTKGKLCNLDMTEITVEQGRKFRDVLNTKYGTGFVEFMETENSSVKNTPARFFRLDCNVINTTLKPIILKKLEEIRLRNPQRFKQYQKRAGILADPESNAIPFDKVLLKFKSECYNLRIEIKKDPTIIVDIILQLAGIKHDQNCKKDIEKCSEDHTVCFELQISSDDCNKLLTYFNNIFPNSVTIIALNNSTDLKRIKIKNIALFYLDVIFTKQLHEIKTHQYLLLDYYQYKCGDKYTIHSCIDNLKNISSELLKMLLVNNNNQNKVIPLKYQISTNGSLPIRENVEFLNTPKQVSQMKVEYDIQSQPNEEITKCNESISSEYGLIRFLNAINRLHHSLVAKKKSEEIKNNIEYAIKMKHLFYAGLMDSNPELLKKYKSENLRHQIKNCLHLLSQLIPKLNTAVAYEQALTMQF